MEKSTKAREKLLTIRVYSDELSEIQKIVSAKGTTVSEYVRHDVFKLPLKKGRKKVSQPV